MKCWICGNDADSGEHRIKKSDLITLHGKGPYKAGNSLVMIKDGKQIPIQGPNSKYLKYTQNLCEECNNSTTQKYDIAYSKFVTHLNTNENEILKKRFIDFEQIYSNNFETGQRHLYKYLVKSFGCRLVEAGRSVPAHLVDLLSKKAFKTNLRITFAVNEDKALLMKDNVRIVGNGELFWSQQPDKTGEYSYTFSEYFSYLHIFHWYNCDYDGSLGASWTANSRYIYLGSFSPLPSEMREEMIQKIEENVQQ
jgi:hypothetical protein